MKKGKMILAGIMIICLTILGLPLTHQNVSAAGSGDVLQLTVTNDSSATANKYIYKKFSNKSVTFQSGDKIEYDVYLSNSVVGSGGIEIYNSDGTYFRDTAGWTDQNGVSGHPNSNIATFAFNNWFHRVITVPSTMVGKSSARWEAAGENDTASYSYTAKYDNVIVTNGGSTRATVFANSADFNLSGDEVIAAISSSSLTVVTAPAALPSMTELFDNQAFMKMDKVNTTLGSSFGMHFVSSVWVNDTLYTYYILHPSGNPSEFDIGLATSTDGVNFTDQGMVLGVGASGHWDSTMASFPGIWYDNGTFYLVYEGSGTNDAGDVGLATSANGTSFTRVGSSGSYDYGRILTHNTTGWERTNIGTPSLYKVGPTWYVFYHGFGDGAGGGSDDCQVGFASGTSLTGLTKNSSNPVVATSTTAANWDSGTIGHRDIIYQNGKYYMVFEGSTDQPYSTAHWATGFAVSSDLVNWSKFAQNNVIGQTPGNFGNDGPSFTSISGKTWIYYRSDGGGPTKRAEVANETSGGFDASWGMNSTGIGHVIGATDGDGWSATVGAGSSNHADYMQYGPYSTTIPVGYNIATWKLLVTDNSSDNANMVRLEVSDFDNNGAILAQRIITRQMWKQTNRYEYFSVPFKNITAGHRIELRVHWYNNGYVREQKLGTS